MLSNAYFLANFRFDTAENEPPGDVDLTSNYTHESINQLVPGLREGS